MDLERDRNVRAGAEQAFHISLGKAAQAQRAILRDVNQFVEERFDLQPRRANNQVHKRDRAN